MNLASKILIVSSLLALGALPTPALASFSPKTPPTQGLVGWWTFDSAEVTDKIYDRSGKANNGYFYNGATSTAKVAGTIGQALSFDGSDDYVDLGTATLASGAFTLAAWVKTDPSDTNNDPIAGLKIGAGVIVYHSSSDNGNNSAMVGFRGANEMASPSNSVSNNVWQHLVFTYDGVDSTAASSFRIYINGVSQTVSKRTAGTIGSSTTRNYIAREEVSRLPGLIDDVRIYNRALSAAEVAQLYRSTQSISRANASQSGKVTSGLVGLWTFDNPDIAGVTAYDRSGQGNNGTLTNGPTRALGRLGQALQFDTNNYVQIPTSGLPTGSTNRTLSAWVKINAFNGGTVNDESFFAGYGNFGTTNAAYLIMTDGSSKVLRFSQWGAAVNAATVLQTGRWYHVVVTNNGNSVSLYVNGVLDGTGSVTINTSSSGNDLYVGRIAGANGDARKLNGLIDEVRVYNRALSPDEIKGLYNKGSATKSNVASPGSNSLTNGLVGYWSFNSPDIAGVTAYDRSGQTNDGTLTSGPSRALGRLGQALLFDGNTQYVSIPNSSGLQLTTGTMSAWIKYSGYTTLCHVTGNSSCGIVTKQNAYGLFQRTPSNTIALFDWSVGQWRDTGVSLADGKWHQVTVTFQSGVANGTTIYLDGISRLTTTFTVSSQAFSPEIARGGSQNATSQAQLFQGSVDEVRIYNRALSEAEIKRLYNLGR